MESSDRPADGDGSRSELVSAAFRSVMGSADVPVMVKDDDGVYVFANRAAELFLDYDPGQIAGMHILELVANDPIWLQAEFDRFKAQRVWNGRLTFKRRSGELATAVLNAFSATAGGASTYTAFLHPVPPEGRIARAPLRLRGQNDLTASDLRLLQLAAEGFTDRELAAILGMSEWAVTRDVALVLQKMRVRSRTEACIRAIKIGLIL